MFFCGFRGFRITIPYYNIYLCKDSVFSANGKISLGKMLFLGGFGAEKVKYY